MCYSCVLDPIITYVYFLSYIDLGYLRTHNFLQPLEERIGKTCSKEKASLEVSTAEKPPPPPPADPPPSVEHLLPGGIGTYSISNISYFNPKVPKPEATPIYSVAQASSTERNDENSNCSSYTGSGFTLWEESAVKKGKTGKENIREKAHAVRGKCSCIYSYTIIIHSMCMLCYFSFIACIIKKIHSWSLCLYFNKHYIQTHVPFYI